MIYASTIDDYMSLVIEMAKKLNLCIYIIIDEYDYILQNLDGSQSTQRIIQLYKNFFSLWKHTWFTDVVKKTFVTGITPLFISQLISSIRYSHISFKKELAGMLGLEKQDIQDFIEFLTKDNRKYSKEQISNYINSLVDYLDGYSFAFGTSNIHMFNTHVTMKLVINNLMGPDLNYKDCVENNMVSIAALQFAYTYKYPRQLLSDYILNSKVGSKYKISERDLITNCEEITLLDLKSNIQEEKAHMKWLIYLHHTGLWNAIRDPPGITNNLTLKLISEKFYNLK